MSSNRNPAGELCHAFGGVVRWSQLRQAGVQDAAVRSARRSGEVVPLAKGWYATPEAIRSPPLAHVRRARAIAASCAGGVVLSHYTALIAAGIPVARVDLATVHLAVAGRDQRRRRPGLVVHRLPEGVDVVDGRVSTACAVVQTGLVAGAAAVVVSGDAAVAGGVRLAELEAALSAYRRTPGLAAVRAAVAALDHRSESPGESLLRWDLRCCGIPVVSQYEVAVAGRRYRADFRVVGERVLVEFDGLGKYDDPGVLRAERQREADLRADGWEIVRFTWDDLGHLVRIATRVQAARERARRLQGS